jgi:cytidylate kinase
MEQRDADDGSRADSPLTLDGRYTLVDTSAKPVEAVVEEIENAVRRGI